MLESPLMATKPPSGSSSSGGGGTASSAGGSIIEVLIALGILVGLAYVVGKLLKSGGKALFEGLARAAVQSALPKYVDLRGHSLSFELGASALLLAKRADRRVVVLGTDSSRAGMYIQLQDMTGLEAAKRAAD